MKKLMIAAAAAAMIGGAFADAQVYEYKLNLTTTTCKEGKATKNTYWTKIAGYEAGDEISYRAKTSLVLQGLTWGCNCSEALAGYWDNVCDNEKSWFGITFWCKKTDAFLGGGYDGTTFEWDFINRIGKKANEVEFSLALVPSEECTSCSDTTGDDVTPDQLTDFELNLAGMGTVTDNFKLNEDDEITDCNSYIKSAKGSVAGYILPDDGIVICNYCEEYDVPCAVYPFCDDCCEHAADGFEIDEDMTVAFGTFTMKYNASASKKLEKTGKISTSYTGFSKNVKAALVAANE